jgi:hypothetical protein
VLFVLLLALFNPSYVEPYRHPFGQLVLSIVIGFFAAGFLWLKRLSSYDVPERFLRSDPALVDLTGGRVVGGLSQGNRPRGTAAPVRGVVP